MTDHSAASMAAYPQTIDEQRTGHKHFWFEKHRTAFDNGQAAGWAEACMAFGWALDNGPAESAAAYVAANNPHRPASTTGSDQP